MSIIRCTALGLYLLSFAGGAYAFDAFGGVGPGTHIGSAIEAIAADYGLQASTPVVVKTMPMYGLPTYAWPRFGPAELFCEATRDVDIFFFGPLYPHAQTPEFNYRRELSDERLEAIELSALWDYLRNVAGWIEKARQKYRSGEPREATYLLGFVTHSYQDLWAHRGITNGMHLALLAHRGIDVDGAPDRVAELRRRLPVWLGKMPALLGDQGNAFLAYISSGETVITPTLAERKRWLGRGRDIFIQGIIYKGFTTKAELCLRYQARLEWDVDALDAILGDRIALDAIVAMKNEPELRAFLDAKGYRF